MATPSRSRHHDILADDPRFPRPKPASAAPNLDKIPPSSVSRISDSARKAEKSSPFSKDGTWRSGNDVPPTVEQTPTRGSTKLFGHPTGLSGTMAAGGDLVRSLPHATKLGPTEANPGSFLSYSLPSWPLKVQETPSKGRTADHNHQQEKQNVDATPNRPVLVTKDSTSAFAVTAFSSSQEQEPSLYASLGWDDDADELS